MPKSIDLFDDATMSFGDHLETLRVHLFKSLLGLIVSVSVMLFFADSVVDIIRRPIDKALRDHHSQQALQFDEDAENLQSKPVWERLTEYWDYLLSGEIFAVPKDNAPEAPKRSEIDVTFSRADLAKLIYEIDPEAEISFDLPDKAEEPKSDDNEAATESTEFTLRLKSPAFLDLQQTIDNSNRPITLNVQEAFMIYLKVAVVSGLVFAFPWIAYQMWLFVAAGLYEHEKRYVFVFLPTSMFLFSLGAVFCYFAVFPFVLEFLLEFNAKIGVSPQLRLSEWISFALVLPVMFGISFQLPLVMYFVERMGFVSVKAFREKRRLAILIIATLSMFLTPADPMSMIMMMVPLIILYELGIYFCRMSPKINPYQAES
ncbi:MAG: twin-arginine translocase subunit TatC [Planctomycetaceae bacterium]|jgi:sec-independent protein translocase protein TatC|nr:twin-arginine translocase subunit TatC [Planctomycetaceae bacterium]